MFAQVQAAPPPTPDPFIGAPVVHYGFHLYPLRGSGPVEPWRWHVERWNAIAEHATGRLMVGIVTSKETTPIEEVRAALSSRFEIRVAPNTPEGENPTFEWIQSQVPKGPDDVLIYAHSKGVRPQTAASQSIRLWSELMYATVVENPGRVVEKLAEGFKAFGSMRSYDYYLFSLRYRWHYSGTFFAVRAKHLPLRIRPAYGGVEAACGAAFPPEECWCEFGDNSPIMGGYDLNHLCPDVLMDAFQWEVDRIGGPRCEQHKRELDWFLDRLKPTDRVLVIGSRQGGLEHQMRRRHPGIETLSIDIDPLPGNTERLLLGSSTDPAIQQQAREQGPWDVVFIDGDHTLAGVTADWEFAQTLSPRLIAFHDVAKAILHDQCGCVVDPLWAEIKATHSTEEMIVGCGWGGIGIVHMGDRNAA